MRQYFATHNQVVYALHKRQKRENICDCVPGATIRHDWSLLDFQRRHDGAGDWVLYKKLVLNLIFFIHLNCHDRLITFKCLFYSKIF